ncbi:DUF6585 family protein [Nocardia sp. NPDC005746]|uniref:DUF6585 family protein n=1 Tax=Nocardia sp. NPDC005746 TaxID=3157062 RepID=UPI0033E155AC
MRSVDAEREMVSALGQYSHGYTATRPDSRVHLVSGTIVAVSGLTAIIGFTMGATALGVLATIPAAVLGARLLLWDLPWLAARLGSDHGARLDWFEHGIVVTSCQGVRAVRFDEMRVWRRVAEGAEGSALSPMSLTYRVGTASGEAVTIPAGIRGREQWGPALVRVAVSARLPGARARLDAGVRLEFGPFRITRTTVHGNQVALWIQVRRITVHEGLIGVWIRRGGKDVLLQAYPTELVNDIDLFWALSRDLRSE